MAKRKPVSSSKTPTDIFSDMTIQGRSGYLAFPASMTKEIEKLTRDANSPARKTLNQIAALKVNDTPAGERMVGGIYYVGIGFSGKDTKGFAYLPPDRQKDMPATILGTMTYGEFAALKQGRGPAQALKEQVNELRNLYPDRTVAAKPQRILSTHKVYSTSMGITG